MPSMSRRYFLMAGGTLVALPFFESLLPRQSRAAAVAALPQRMALFHAPCGFNMSTFTPTATGPGYPLSPTLKPLAALQKNMLVLSNMNNMSAINNNAGNGKHAIGMATLFTGAAVKYDQPQPAGSASVDQIYAKSQAGKTAVGSLQLGVRIDADCDVDLPCVDIMTVSWADANTPLAAQTDPIAVFNNFFSGGSSQQAATAQAARRATRQSVLDAVLGQANGLSKKLGSADSQKLDQYLTSVRALEMQLGATPSASCSPANAVPASIGSSDYQTLYSTMMKLMVLAFQCDLTRSISFSFGEGHCDHLYDFLPGINDIHHSISHHDGDPNKFGTVDDYRYMGNVDFFPVFSRPPSDTRGIGDLVRQHRGRPEQRARRWQRA